MENNNKPVVHLISKPENKFQGLRGQKPPSDPFFDPSIVKQSKRFRYLKKQDKIENATLIEMNFSVEEKEAVNALINSESASSLFERRLGELSFEIISNSI